MELGEKESWRPSCISSFKRQLKLHSWTALSKFEEPSATSSPAHFSISSPSSAHVANSSVTRRWLPGAFNFAILFQGVWHHFASQFQMYAIAFKFWGIESPPDEICSDIINRLMGKCAECVEPPHVQLGKKRPERLENLPFLNVLEDSRRCQSANCHPPISTHKYCKGAFRLSRWLCAGASSRSESCLTRGVVRLALKYSCHHSVLSHYSRRHHGRPTPPSQISPASIKSERWSLSGHVIAISRPCEGDRLGRALAPPPSRHRPFKVIIGHQLSRCSFSPVGR